LLKCPHLKNKNKKFTHMTLRHQTIRTFEVFYFYFFKWGILTKKVEIKRETFLGYRHCKGYDYKSAYSSGAVSFPKKNLVVWWVHGIWLLAYGFKILKFLGCIWTAIFCFLVVENNWMSLNLIFCYLVMERHAASRKD
jgi:hypothetical protein